MATIPIQAGHHDDFVLILVQIEDTDTMREVAQKIAEHTVGIRVKKKPKPLKVYYEGKAVEDHLTVADVGIKPMGYVEVTYVE